MKKIKEFLQTPIMVKTWMMIILGLALLVDTILAIIIVLQKAGVM